MSLVLIAILLVALVVPVAVALFRRHGGGAVATGLSGAMADSSADAEIVETSPDVAPVLPHTPPSLLDAVPTSATPNVFINYRRADVPETAGRVFDRLSAALGADAVFKDVDSIPLGVDYREFIDEAVGRCDVMLVLIGPSWLTAGAAEKPRLDDPNDPLRLEIESALRRNIPSSPCSPAVPSYRARRTFQNRCVRLPTAMECRCGQTRTSIATWSVSSTPSTTSCEREAVDRMQASQA